MFVTKDRVFENIDQLYLKILRDVKLIEGETHYISSEHCVCCTDGAEIRYAEVAKNDVHSCISENEEETDPRFSNGSEHDADLAIEWYD